MINNAAERQERIKVIQITDNTNFLINNKSKMKIDYIKQDLLRFAEFLKKRGIKFRCVGSIALQVCGLNLGRDPEDIDVEVECSEEQEKLFKDLAEAYGSTFHNVDYGPDRKPFIFKFGETIINVWTYRRINDNSVYRNGVAFAPINDVLKKKLAYKRKKDFADLLYVISNLSEMANK